MFVQTRNRARVALFTAGVLAAALDLSRWGAAVGPLAGPCDHGGGPQHDADVARSPPAHVADWGGGPEGASEAKDVAA